MMSETTNVADDCRIGHGGDAALCEDDELASLPENYRVLSGRDGVTGGWQVEKKHHGLIWIIHNCEIKTRPRLFGKEQAPGSQR